MAKKKKKFKIIKTAGLLTATGLMVAVSTFKETTPTSAVEYTSEELNDNKEYLSELEEIKNEEPVFNNAELYNYICKKYNKEYLYESELKLIYEINIDEELTNTDLSDLKYLPNLQFLTIKNNNIDLEDIKYNSKLRQLSIENCTIKNTSEIPNTTTYLLIQNSNIEDNNLVIPYYTSTLELLCNNFSNLTLKEPNNLKYLYIHGDSFLDLESIRGCTNLNHLALKRISNVKNAEVLLDLNIKELELDDYSPIWITTNIFEKLNNKNNNYDTYIDESKELDKIASSINKDLSEEEIIKEIVIYVIDNLEYNHSVVTPEGELYSKAYNNEPIRYALKQEGVCINYCTLFQALANRCGINSYVLYSEKHGWNAIERDGELRYIDPTFLDEQAVIYLLSSLVGDLRTSKEILLEGDESNLYYYDFNEVLEKELGLETHKAENLPKEYNDNYRLGYVDESKNMQYITIKVGNKYYRCFRLEFILKMSIAYLLLHIIYTGKSLLEDKRKEKEIHKKALKMRNKKVDEFDYL